jgi:Fe-S-cluster containining protein
VNAKNLKKKLLGIPPRELDEQFHEAHASVFEATDCLSCANCCKTTSPIIKESDINRMSFHMKMQPSVLIRKYLIREPDGSYVVASSPCPFLQSDNYCGIYDARPAACREYPHTNRKKMHQILDLTFKNASICPAVEKILQQISNI